MASLARRQGYRKLPLSLRVSGGTMALWDKLMGELVDIVEWLDDSTDTLGYRFERTQNQIKHGANRVVGEGQMPAFIDEATLADGVKPGAYELTTHDLPILATLRGWKYG